MSDVIEFDKDPENSGIRQEQRRLQRLLEDEKQCDINNAIKLLEENGYEIKKK